MQKEPKNQSNTINQDNISSNYDVVVIGSGPAGYRAAVQAAKMHKKVCIIEKTPGKLGGAWIHTGTIPSKSLRESLDAIHSIRSHAGAHWVDRIIQDLSPSKLMGQAARVSQFEESIVRRYFERYHIKLIEGKATLDDAHTVRVTGADGRASVIQTKFILIATGSRPRRPDHIPFDGWRVVDGDDILRLESLPKRLTIYGAGVIGCEYGCIFNALGVKVQVVDSRSAIMQFVDREIAEALKSSMQEHGIEFILDSRTTDVKAQGSTVLATLDNGKVIESDVFFFAAGRQPNSDRLGLERLGIQCNERGEIIVNENFQSSNPNIYAAGDTIGPPALAATAATQGRHAACHMFGTQRRPFPKIFPIGIYTIPELSSVGATEEDLNSQGKPFVVGRAHYSEVARGYIRGDTHGLLKLIICRETHQILGIHIVGHDACNLIHIGMAFMQKGGHAQDLVDMIFNYPTLAEAYRIAAFNALNKIFPSGEICDPPSEGAQNCAIPSSGLDSEEKLTSLSNPKRISGDK